MLNRPRGPAPWHHPIANNPLDNRDQLRQSLEQLLAPLGARFVCGGSGLALGTTGAEGPGASLFEGSLRLLWGLVPLWLAGGENAVGAAVVRGMGGWFDPDPETGGCGLPGPDLGAQVDLAPLALGLLLVPDRLWAPLSDPQRAQLVRWLGRVNGEPTRQDAPTVVLVNLALGSLGQPSDVQKLDWALGTLGGGGESKADDAFGPLFLSVVASTVVTDVNPDLERVLRERARAWGQGVGHWFDSEARVVPYGPGLGARCSVAAFLAACAFADLEVVPWGTMRRLVLSHLRWWFSQPIFDHEGVLTAGFGYPNPRVAHPQHGPGAAYEVLKVYLLLAVPPGHPFWTSENDPPVDTDLVVPGASVLLCRTGQPDGDAVALVAGHYEAESAQGAALGAKFAYSSRFGFCLSGGSHGLSQVGCDGSLVLSEGDGYWRERRHVQNRVADVTLVGSRWRPWPDVSVVTRLVPWDSGHVRVHLVDTRRALEVVEGGFSLPEPTTWPPSALFVQRQGLSGLVVSNVLREWGAIFDLQDQRVAALHRPEPDLNVLHPRVQIPVLKSWLVPGRHLLLSWVGGGGPGALPPRPLPEWGRDTPTGRLALWSADRRLVLDIDLATDFGGAP